MCEDKAFSNWNEPVHSVIPPLSEVAARSAGPAPVIVSQVQKCAVVEKCANTKRTGSFGFN